METGPSRDAWATKVLRDGLGDDFSPRHSHEEGFSHLLHKLRNSPSKSCCTACLLGDLTGLYISEGHLFGLDFIYQRFVKLLYLPEDHSPDAQTIIAGYWHARDLPVGRTLTIWDLEKGEWVKLHNAGRFGYKNKMSRQDMLRYIMWHLERGNHNDDDDSDSEENDGEEEETLMTH